ncbi:hypothetical protein FI667_g16008, partial [Globisporangium splendens]
MALDHAAIDDRSRSQQRSTARTNWTNWRPRQTWDPHELHLKLPKCTLPSRRRQMRRDVTSIARRGENYGANAANPARRRNRTEDLAVRGRGDKGRRHATSDYEYNAQQHIKHTLNDAILNNASLIYEFNTRVDTSRSPRAPMG